MPAKDQVDPESLRTKLRAHLASHPGWHESRSIADALGISRGPERTALVRELNRLVRNGTVVSYRPRNLPSRGPGTLFAANPGTDPTSLTA